MIDLADLADLIIIIYAGHKVIDTLEPAAMLIFDIIKEKIKWREVDKIIKKIGKNK